MHEKSEGKELDEVEIEWNEMDTKTSGEEDQRMSKKMLNKPRKAMEQRIVNKERKDSLDAFATRSPAVRPSGP